MAGTDAYQMKLRGNPWSQWSRGSAALYSRSLLCHVAMQLLAAGLRPVASADVSSKYDSQTNGSDYPVDVHSWWVVQEPKSQDVHAPFFYAQIPIVQGSVVRPSEQTLAVDGAVAGAVVDAVAAVQGSQSAFGEDMNKPLISGKKA